ncbi:nucleotidyl transferase AbiEii/AbiGii toxin family protein [Methylocella tundrae]|uniref:nucleotidyl transferase AbiEii/AbiGii toxin family protein n=1 Tax=Methylocella tundrae TaxID=227605 RepID=UPI001FCEE623|nr:nucleotidyl transferase AbiEii/AbiGii toxin family protein [Methylocella tundrae]
MIRLIDILDAFGTDTLIGLRIALKGGTALNVFHSDLDRLSVDIDVNYVGAVEKEQMDTDRPGLEDRIERLVESKGYTARPEPSEHAGGKWIYRYASALGGAGTIEIDINYLYRSPLYGVDHMSSAAIGPYRATNVPVLDIHEIVAGEMVALVTRRTARDLFDAHRIIAMPDLDWAKIKAATLMIGASAKSFDRRTASPDDIGCEVGDITGKLIMCLHDRYFDRFGGPAIWIESVTAACREKLAPLFQFTVGERAFLDGVLDRGEIDAPPLGVPEAMRGAIEACPALRWKAQNIKAWKSGDKSLVPRVTRGRRPPREPTP